MKFKILFSAFLIGVFCFLASAQYVLAQQPKGVIVTPKRVVFGENERTKEIILANRGDQEAKYRVSIINRSMTQSGQLVPAETAADGEFFADKFVRFGPRQVTLAPKQSQKVRILSRLPSTAADGEYRSHVLVQEIPEAGPAENAGDADAGALGINVQAIFGISLPIIMRKGELDAAVELANPKIAKREGKTFLDIDLQRSGNKSVFGTLKVFADGKEVGILKNVAIYLSTPVRQASVRINDEYAETLSGKSLKVTFGAVEANEDAPETETRFTAR